ncbi:MAG: hypothetical protein EXQ96_03485 [Alphaproteobacteria bacterium]|nr:hypothetical protein [Alphaproteobacteria bacterium]
MGALGHYLEREGIPTTQISLVREHTAAIRPPRALWVPFEFGRPLGAPDAPAFQKKVLLAALRLLEGAAVPQLVEFPEEAPDAADAEGLTCPIALAAPASAGGRAGELAREIATLAPWYALARARRGRTTVGISGLEVGEAAAFLVALPDRPWPESPRQGVSIGQTVKLAATDLMAYYQEALAAQPQAASARQRSDWFWGETVAGRVLLALRAALAASDDRLNQAIAENLIVPRAQLHRLG